MSDQPQEWTAENVLMMLQGSQMNTPYSDIAKAHNAAIAAEREKWNLAIEELKQQLAAEREAHRPEQTQPDSLVPDEITQLREQLDAEREALATANREWVKIYHDEQDDNKQLRAKIERMSKTICPSCLQLREQLAAERERIDEIWRIGKAELAAEQKSHEQATEAHGRALRELDQQLADERDKRRIDLEHILDLERQLADDRELSKQAMAAQRHMNACRGLLKVPDDEVLYVAIEELQQQLAAERGRCERGLCKGAALFAGKEAETIQRLREQLAAAQQAALEWATCNAKLEDQLAAEREKTRRAESANIATNEMLDRLREQVAYERKDYAAWRMKLNTEHEQLREQLDAAVEALKQERNRDKKDYFPFTPKDWPT